MGRKDQRRNDDEWDDTSANDDVDEEDEEDEEEEDEDDDDNHELTIDHTDDYAMEQQQVEQQHDISFAEESFQSVLDTIQLPITSNTNTTHPKGAATTRNPKMIRLAAVTCAICDIIASTPSSESSSSSSSKATKSTKAKPAITPSQVYAQAITALEGTLKVGTTDAAATSGDMITVMMDTFATTNAILELLCITIPYVTKPSSSSISSSSSSGSTTTSSTATSNILAHTLQPFASRVLRAIVQSSLSFASTIGGITTDQKYDTSGGGGGSNAVLRNVCRVSAILLQHLPITTNTVAVQQFVHGTFLQLLLSDTVPPKVRKASQNALLEVFTSPYSSNSKTQIHPGIQKSVDAYVHNELQVMISKPLHDTVPLQRCLHLLPFLERAILYLDYPNISDSIMTYLTNIILASSTTTMTTTNNDFVTVKVQEMTPKMLVIASILQLVHTILQDRDDSDTHYIHPVDTTSFINVFGRRVIASLLQSKAHFFVLVDNAAINHRHHHHPVGSEIASKTKVLYGQVIIAALQHLIMDCSNQHNQSNDNSSRHESIELVCKLLPLGIQAIIQLSKPQADMIVQKTSHMIASKGSNNNHNRTGSMIAQTLFAELTQLVRTSFPILLQQQQHLLSKNTATNITKCCNDIVQCMTATILSDVLYRTTWSISLPMISIFIQISHTILSLEDISSMMESIISLHKTGKHDIENAVSTLIQGVGIETCWPWIIWNTNSINNNGKKKRNATTTIISLDRAWILSVMKSAANTSTVVAADGIVPLRLEFFQKDVLEIARKCDTVAKTSPSVSDRKASHARVIELWNLFPCFCRSPTDITTILPALTTTLGRVLGDTRYPELLVRIEFVSIFELC
jgi:NUC173 domain